MSLWILDFDVSLDLESWSLVFRAPCLELKKIHCSHPLFSYVLLAQFNEGKTLWLIKWCGLTCRSLTLTAQFGFIRPCSALHHASRICRECNSRYLRMRKMKCLDA